jgi:hypothetical protein
LLYTADELDLLEQDIADTRAAIKRLKKIGQENSNDSGGSSRSVKEADLDTLLENLKDLIRNKQEITGEGGAFYVGKDW